MFIESDIVLSGADYHHSETLLDLNTDNIRKRIGIKKYLHLLPYFFILDWTKNLKTPNITILFFDADFEKHAEEIYDEPKWPSIRYFMLMFPSKTDRSMAPKGCEALFILMPIAPNIEDTPELRNTILKR